MKFLVVDDHPIVNDGLAGLAGAAFLVADTVVRAHARARARARAPRVRARTCARARARGGRVGDAARALAMAVEHADLEHRHPRHRHARHGWSACAQRVRPRAAGTAGDCDLGLGGRARQREKRLRKGRSATCRNQRASIRFSPPSGWSSTGISMSRRSSSAETPLSPASDPRGAAAPASDPMLTRLPDRCPEAIEPGQIQQEHRSRVRSLGEDREGACHRDLQGPERHQPHPGGCRRPWDAGLI